MYLAMILLLLFVLPVASIAIEHLAFPQGASLLALTGIWFVFWAVGVRPALAGLRQIFNPAFTAETIFGIKEVAPRKIVQELGFANLSIGVLGIASIVHAPWTIPAAIVGGLFYLLAGIKHVLNQGRSRTEVIAMVSDLFIALVLGAYLAAVFVVTR
ncbi:hypothetical protein OSH11_04195 [Kaistia dalseonensis]|uniref:Membrane protein n=1 Tax=Kaistia dalseonensis TaxID=410840 RepID=A0ABU0H2C4_9HYPH|nr:DUF6790 family protein [Kaistia dalseonensis]MCX5493894.1 hypothetical protein [Kaistia dalseonensis]MDQ0436460.1 putative membrane protein [Kaistia dalseonensis]